jgi:hypothetical protein
MKIFKFGSTIRAVSFKLLLEGFVKFNVLFFCVCLVLFYIKRLQVQDYFHFMKNQMLLVVIATLFAKCYERVRREVPFKELNANKMSFFFGTLFSVIFLYASALILKRLPMKAWVFYLLLYHFLLAVTYWAVILILGKSNLMKNLIKLLKTCIEYKNFFKLFVIFNVAFFVVVLTVLVAASQHKSILEIIFVVFYFEISFLIFHIAVAHLVDFIWLPENKKPNNVSLLGVCVGSVIYALKFNIIDRKLIGSFATYDKFLLVAIVSLILFWIFFTLLFHLRWNNLLKRKT